MRPTLATPTDLDDRWLMAVGIPGFGLTIPFAVGLYGPLGPGDPRAWVGAVGFVVLAAAIWWGNRWLLFEQRRHWDWFRHPWRRLVVLVAGVVLYTAPLSAAWIVGWFRFADLPVDADAVRTVALMNTICVLVVSHLYETLFLLRERIDDATRMERADRARVQAELDALRQQVDPHFLFNALNTLAWLVESRPAEAAAFTTRLAEVYRYVLDHRHHDLVPLREELAFLEAYAHLLRLRFGAGFDLEVAVPDDAVAIPPVSLQVLVENAVKHNAFGDGRPLGLTVRLEGDEVVVRNRVRPRRGDLPSAGVGLRNLRERVLVGTGRPLGVQGDAEAFEVRVPVVREVACAAS